MNMEGWQINVSLDTTHACRRVYAFVSHQLKRVIKFFTSAIVYILVLLSKNIERKMVISVMLMNLTSRFL
jgi:hypothetical protein